MTATAIGYDAIPSLTIDYSMNYCIVVQVNFDITNLHVTTFAWPGLTVLRVKKLLVIINGSLHRFLVTSSFGTPDIVRSCHANADIKNLQHNEQSEVLPKYAVYQSLPVSASMLEMLLCCAGWGVDSDMWPHFVCGVCARDMLERDQHRDLSLLPSYH